MRGNQATNAMKRIASQITSGARSRTNKTTISNSFNICDSKLNVASRRTLSSQLRQQRHLQTIRSGISVEASSLRYANMIDSEASLFRGWDIVLEEDEDGT